MDALIASRREYTDQLVALTRPLFVQGLLSLYGHVLQNNKSRALVLRELQQALRSVRQWSHETLVREEQRFLSASRYEWLEELLKAVFIVNVQILTQAAAVEAGALDVQVPSLRSFIHRTYIELSRSLWRRPELMHHAVPTEHRQANLAAVDKMVEKAILATIRDSLPYRELLPRVLHPPPPPPPEDAAAIPVGGGAEERSVIPAAFTPITMSVAPSLCSEPTTSGKDAPPPPPHALSDSPEPPPSWKGVGIVVTREEEKEDVEDEQSECASVAETTQTTSTTTKSRKRAKYTRKRRTDGFTPEPEPEPEPVAEEEEDDERRQLIIAPEFRLTTGPSSTITDQPADNTLQSAESPAVVREDKMPKPPHEEDLVNVVRADAVAVPTETPATPKPRRRRADALRRALAAEKTLSAR
jgi:hypothetical protein